MLNFARCSLLALALRVIWLRFWDQLRGLFLRGAPATGNPNGGSQPGGGSVSSAGTGVHSRRRCRRDNQHGHRWRGCWRRQLARRGCERRIRVGRGLARSVVDPNDVVSDAPLSMQKPAFMSATHSLMPHAVFGGHAAPLPTDAFWENMVLDTGDFLTNAFPFHVNAQAAGVALSRPEMLTTSDKFCYESAPIAVVLGASRPSRPHRGKLGSGVRHAEVLRGLWLDERADRLRHGLRYRSV